MVDIFVPQVQFFYCTTSCFVHSINLVFHFSQYGTMSCNILIVFDVDRYEI